MSVILDYIVGLLLFVLSLVTSFIANTTYKIVGLKDGSALAKSVMGTTEAQIKNTVLGKELMDNFMHTFPVFETFFEVFLALAQIIVITLVVIGMVKALFGPLSKTSENPIVLASRGALASFLIKYSAIIAGVFLHMGSILFISFQQELPPEKVIDAINSMSKADTFSDLAGDVAKGALIMFAPGGGLYALGMGLLLVFLFIGLISNYIKLVLEIIERYITMCFLALLSPLFIACLASSSSMKYFFGWCKMMFSQAVLLGFSSLWLNAINLTLANSATGGESSMIRTIGWIGVILLITSFTVMGSKLDQHMRTLGFTVAQGGDFGHSIFAAYAATKSLARTGGNAVSKGTASNIRARSGLGGLGSRTGGPGGKPLQRTVNNSGGINTFKANDLNMGAKNAGKNGGNQVDTVMKSDKGKVDTLLDVDSSDPTTPVGFAKFGEGGEDDISLGKDEKGNEHFLSEAQGTLAEQTAGSTETGDGAIILDDMSNNAEKLEDDDAIVGFQDDEGKELSNIIEGDPTMEGHLDGDTLRDELNGDAVELSAGDSLVAIDAQENELGEHDVLGSYQIGENSLDENNNLKTYDFDEATGDFTLNEDGRGQYFMDANGDYVGFNELAEGGQVAVESGAPLQYGDYYDASNQEIIDAASPDLMESGNMLRDSLTGEDAVQLSAGDSLVTLSDHETDEFGRTKVLGSYELGENSLNEDGSIKTFSRDWDTGEYTEESDGSGMYMVDSDGKYHHFADVAAQGPVAIQTPGTIEAGDSLNTDMSSSVITGSLASGGADLSGDELRDNLSNYNFSDGDTLTSANARQDELGHQVLGSYELGANSIDSDGKLMTFDYDEETGKYSYNTDGKGQFFMDREGVAVSFDDAAAGGMVAVGKGTDGSYFMDRDKQEHELASGSIIHDGEGGLYGEVRDKKTGQTYMSSFEAGVKNRDRIVTTDAMEQVVDKDNIGNIKSTFHSQSGPETIGSIESRGGLNEATSFKFNDSDLSKDDREKFGGGRRFYFADSRSGDTAIANGRINTEENDKVSIKDEKGNVYTVSSKSVRNAQPLNTVESSMQSKTLSDKHNQGISYTDAHGQKQELQFAENSVKNGRITAVDSQGNSLGRAAKDGDNVRMFDTNTKQYKNVSYSDIKKAEVGNYSHNYNGMNVTKDGQIKASDISHIKNNGNHQEIYMKDGSVGMRTDSRYIDKSKLQEKDQKYFTEYKTGSNFQNKGSDKMHYHSTGQYEGRFYGRPSSREGFMDYNTTESRRMASQITNQKNFKAGDVKSISSDNNRGISVITTKNGESFGVVDLNKNPSFRHRGDENVSYGKNKANSQQAIISFGKNSKPRDIQDYLNTAVDADRSVAGQVKKVFNEIAKKNFTFNRPTKN